MRILFLTFPHYGHIKVHLRLLQKLQDVGFEIFGASSPRYQEMIESAGIKYIDYAQFIRYGLFKQNIKMFENSVSTNYKLEDKVIHCLYDYESTIRQCKIDADLCANALKEMDFDIVLYDTAILFGALVGINLNIPSVSLSTEMAINQKMAPLNIRHFLKYIIGLDVENIEQEQEAYIKMLINKFGKKFKKRYGIEFCMHNSPDLNILYLCKEMQKNIDCLDDSFIFAGYDLDQKYDVNKNKKEKHLIYITQGSEGRYDIKLIESIINTFYNTPYEVIITLGTKNIDMSLQPIELPKNITIVHHADQIEILKKTSVYITNGGLSGIREALLLGVPMLFFDDIQFSEQMVELGTGKLLNNEYDSKELRESVECLIKNTEFADCVQQIGNELRSLDRNNKTVNQIIEVIGSKLGGKRWK